MGAWGYGPFDNDAAGDWFDDVDEFLLNKIEETLKGGDVGDLNSTAQWYAAAGLLAGVEDIKYGSYADSEAFTLAIARLDQIIEAAPEMGWKDTSRFVRDVEQVKHKLVLAQRRLRDRRGRWRLKRQQKGLG